MNDSFLREVETRAVQWVRQGGQRALEHFRLPLQVEFKTEGETNPVTEADREIEGLLRSAIAREYPDHAILGEEGTEVDVSERELVWVLDPVDGTTNFWNGLPLFACSAALLWRGEPVVGAVFIPVVPLPAAAVAVAEGGGLRGMPEPLLRSGVVHARRGGGAFLDGTPIRASSASVPLGSNLVGLPAYHARYFHWSGESGRRPGEPRSLGSVCFEMAMVAAGVLQYSLYRRPKIWDVAAGVLAIREAGGEALAWQGERWEPLVCFSPMPKRKKPSEVSLRHWGMSVLTGGSGVVSYAADRIMPITRPSKPTS